MSVEPWLVEGDEGGVVENDPATGLPWTEAAAEEQVARAARHGQTIYAYPADSIQGIRHECPDCHAKPGQRCEPECSSHWI